MTAAEPVVAPVEADDELTIDELAARTGMTVRTVRFYASEGLLPAPVKRGRIAYYGSTHRMRLELVKTLQDRVRLAYLRYNGGVSNLLEALDADRSLFEAELSLAQARRDELLTVVQLYKALGGGWQQ